MAGVASSRGAVRGHWWGNGGLGRAYAKCLAAEGARLVVNDINAESAKSCVDEIIATGGQAIVNTDDITDYASAGDIVKAALEAFGDLHAVVNNAGNNRDRMFTSLTEEDCRRRSEPATDATFENDVDPVSTTRPITAA